MGWAMKFENDVMRALSGADYVREKLLSLAATGPAPLISQTYAIKCRVKSAQSLSNKVVEKRTTNKEYTAFSATDIIGMRLLALYSEELLELTSSLLSYISFCQSPDIQLFVGDSLQDCVQEAIVFKSQDNPDIYDSVYDYLKRKNFGKNEKGKDKLQEGKFSDPKKKYSSIHLVCNSLSYAGDTPRIIPVEFQIRSIFEDAWAEIDHGLRYKFDQKYKKIGRHAADYLESSKDQLWTLKSSLEQAGNQAGNIRNSFGAVIRSIEDSKRKPVSEWTLPLMYRGEPYEDVVSSIFPADMKNDLEAIIDSISDIRNRLNEPVKSDAHYKDLVKKIDSYKSELEKRHTKLKNDHEDLLAKEPALNYFFEMEDALCFVWLGILVQQFDPVRVRKYREFFQDAKNRYESLEKNYRDDCFLAYRLSLVHSLIGQNAEAEFFIKKAFDLLAKQTKRDGSVHEVLIPKYFGFQLWRRRAGILQSGLSSGNPRFVRDDQLSLLEGCLNLTQISLDNLKDSSLDSDEKHIQGVALKNNIISYLWEVFDLVRTRSEYERRVQQIDLAQISSWIEELLADKKTVSEVSKLDTLMKGFELLNDTTKTKKYLKQLSDVLDGEPILHNGNNRLHYYAVERITKRMEDPMPEC